MQQGPCHGQAASTFQEPLISSAATIDPPVHAAKAEARASVLASKQTARKPPLPALTGLRTLLAVNIMFFHFTPPLPRFLRPLVDNAFTFVGFFFLISGFILAYNYADRPVLDQRRFYVARLSRVYPVYLLVLVLSVPFLRFEWGAHTPGEFLTGLVLTPFALQGWIPALATFWNTVGWTLPAELMLYLAFPYILRFIARHAHHVVSVPRLIAAILALWAIGITPHILYFLTNPDHLNGPATRYTYGFWLRALKYTPPAYACTFSAGILLARLHRKLDLSPLHRGFLALSGLLALTVYLAFAAPHIPYVLVHGSLLLPLFAAILLGLAGPNYIATIFAWRPIVLLGETTFALYLLHFNAFNLIHIYKLPERLHVAAYDPWISYAFIMLLAVIVTFQFERPARKFVLARLSLSQ